MPILGRRLFLERERAGKIVFGDWVFGNLVARKIDDINVSYSERAERVLFNNCWPRGRAGSLEKIICFAFIMTLILIPCWGQMCSTRRF